MGLIVIVPEHRDVDMHYMNIVMLTSHVNKFKTVTHTIVE